MSRKTTEGYASNRRGVGHQDGPETTSSVVWPIIHLGSQKAIPVVGVRHTRVDVSEMGTEAAYIR